MNHAIQRLCLAMKLSLEGTHLMDGLISIGLGLLTFATACCFVGLARAMRNDKLPPNMWAGIRTKVASESESSWYQVQRAGSVPLMCLAVAYADSGFLFILQGIYHEILSILIPVIVFSVQSLVGIIWNIGRAITPHHRKTRVEPVRCPRESKQHEWGHRICISQSMRRFCFK